MIKAKWQEIISSTNNLSDFIGFSVKYGNFKGKIENWSILDLRTH